MRSKEPWRPSLDTQQMAERRDIPSFPGGDRVDWNLRQVLPLFHHCWHQARRTSPPKKSWWKYDLHEKRRSRSSSRTVVEKRRLQNINKCADVPSTRTRQRYASHSDADEDKTAQHFGSYLSTKFGMAQPEMADVLRHGHITRHGRILNTGEILHSGESGNQKNGKTKGGGRNGKRRQQTMHIHTSIRKLLRTNIVSIVAHVALSSQISLQSCTFISHVVFLTDFASRHWQMSWTRVQITLHRTHACAHFSRCVSHFAHIIQRTCIGSRCLRDSVCLSKIISSAHHFTPERSWVLCFLRVLSSSTTPPTSLTGIRLKPCATPLWGGPLGLRLQAQVDRREAPVLNGGDIQRRWRDATTRPRQDETNPINFPKRQTFMRFSWELSPYTFSRNLTHFFWWGERGRCAF